MNVPTDLLSQLLSFWGPIVAAFTPYLAMPGIMFGTAVWYGLTVAATLPAAVIPMFFTIPLWPLFWLMP
jgi:hypothetical protein